MCAMSFLGAGLYDDDTAADVRGRYRELVADGAAGEQATDTLLSEWKEGLEEPEIACPFWLALADTQRKVGRLEDRVRDRARQIIASGEDLSRFEHDQALLRRRQVVLDRLQRELSIQQRRPTRIPKPFRSLSPVMRGDVFWFALPSGRRVLFRCVAISGDERSNYPTVEVLDWRRADAPPNPAGLSAVEGRRRGNEAPTNLISVVRYRGDPDPAERITMVASGVPMRQLRSSPAWMVPWTELEATLARFFGL